MLNILLASKFDPPFLFGRLVKIEVDVVHQYQDYYEVPVAADVSPADVARAHALQPAFENFLLTCPMSPSFSSSSLPSAVQVQWGDDTVYFAEVLPGQLVPGGSGLGTFTVDSVDSFSDEDEDEHSEGGEKRKEVQQSDSVGSGSLLRFTSEHPHFSEWLHVPIHPARNDSTTLSKFRLAQLPAIFEQPFNLSSVVHPGDGLPGRLNQSGIAMGAQFFSNGAALSMKSTPLDMGPDFNGFATVEHVLIRLNTTFAPNGTFRVKVPLLSGASGSGSNTARVYNSSVAQPRTVRIIGEGASVPGFVGENMKGSGMDDPLVKRSLKSSGTVDAVYLAAHQNSVNHILKDNGRDASYVPSPALVSFTNGNSPLGYTHLSATSYATARALADTSNVLPYFTGSGMGVARQYPDRHVANTSIYNLQTASTIVFILCVGLISTLFVPRLPLGVPRRGFDLYSRFSAFYAEELVAERREGFGRNMKLGEIVERTKDLRFYYPVDNYQGDYKIGGF
ncbi:hypothetical protein CVT26_009714 [Gymnopilus dilepis]|uniref:Uncharacterized protein n=1 Tax=Gymnopilus dilepis TaxID=231916 RepID=A0A409WCP7_9AGAR|nr:hypothetical protein CVT26_009714 [Gymnopilus dilepis]